MGQGKRGQGQATWQTIGLVAAFVLVGVFFLAGMTVAGIWALHALGWSTADEFLAQTHVRLGEFVVGFGLLSTAATWIGLRLYLPTARRAYLGLMRLSVVLVLGFASATALSFIKLEYTPEPNQGDSQYEFSFESGGLPWAAVAALFGCKSFAYFAHRSYARLATEDQP